jgi:putative tricarboxylic transport membrane protein
MDDSRHGQSGGHDHHPGHSATAHQHGHDHAHDHGHHGARHALSFVRAPQDAAAGVFLLAIAAFALWQSSELPTGTLRQLGSGMIPHLLVVLLAICGSALIINACLAEGAGLERWSLRGPVLILGAAILFAVSIRPLGLAVSGPVLILISGLASPDTKWRETFVFGIVMTAFCLGLFKLLLSLPIPVAPWLIGY